MNELSFLLDLLLNHKLPKATKEAIKARVDEIGKQAQPAVRPQSLVHANTVPQAVQAQAIAQSPETAQALAQRQAAIAASLNSGPFDGKPPPGSTGPRKF